MINKIVKIAMHFSFIKIYGIIFKSLLELFTEMRYNVLPCRCRFHSLPTLFLNKSSFSYPYSTKGRGLRSVQHVFVSCYDKDSAILFTIGSLPDVNPP
jgi:hypothetical protein